MNNLFDQRYNIVQNKKLQSDCRTRLSSDSAQLLMLASRFGDSSGRELMYRN